MFNIFYCLEKMIMRILVLASHCNASFRNRGNQVSHKKREGKQKKSNLISFGNVQKLSKNCIFSVLSKGKTQENTCAIDIWLRCFLVNFAKFSGAPFFIEQIRWLLLVRTKSSKETSSPTPKNSFWLSTAYLFIQKSTLTFKFL